jgi:uncharacterized protein YndB with AHSA1/START domain
VPHVSHRVVVARPIESVFDLATTTKHWPLWHPATRSVEGDIDHPARLGDQIIERVEIAGRRGEGTWTVVEYDRPRHLALEADTGMGRLRISYSFAPTPDGTAFQRDLTYEAPGDDLYRIMDQQSAEAVTRLRDFLEREIPPHA